MPLDVLLFALIAVFFAWKLRQVLGTRNGEEAERPDPFKRPAAAARDGAQTIDGEAREVPPRTAGAPPSSVAGGLNQIRALDTGFDEKRFLANARQAYTMIVEAFAKDDRATLKPLLKADIYDGFVAEMDARAGRGEVLQADIRKITAADIAAARTDGKLAIVTVDFGSEQISVTRNQQGEVIDGDPVRPVEVAEAWIFERDTSNASPAWHLAGTRVL